MTPTTSRSAAETPWADEALIAAALDQANLNALRMALYQQTGDPQLAEMRAESRPIRGGAMFIPALAREDRSIVKAKALDYLRRGPAAPAPQPTLEETQHLLTMFGAPTESPSAARLAFEELAFEDMPRAVAWTRVPSPQVLARYKVTIIGAGISALSAAIRLKALGIPFEIFERQAGIGGTWHLNDYPEARVDVSNFVYQFKFEKNYPWQGSFAAQPEIKAYLEYIVDKYGLREFITLDTEITQGRWDEDQQHWALTLRGPDGGERSATTKILVSASGLFSTPNLPDIEGLGTFKGKVFHTTNWDHGYDLKDKHIALIGTGSSGAQLMPRLARDAASLAVFQRTPNWVLPVEAYRDPVTAEQRWLLDNMPYYWNWFCYAAFLTDLQIEPLQVLDVDWEGAGGGVNERNDLLKAFLENHLERKFADRPDLIEKCRPSYPPAARRLVIDNGWYDALLQANVALVSEPIARITEDAIVTRDGQARAVDMIVLGSGFKTSQYLWPAKYVGRKGRTPSDLWAADGARAYMGMTMPGFPNFFMFYGPNGQARAGGFHGWADTCACYILKIVTAMIEKGADSVDVREDVFRDYNARLDVAMTPLIWGGRGAGSYYLNEHGRSGVNMPWTVQEFYAWIMEPDLTDFELR